MLHVSYRQLWRQWFRASPRALEMSLRPRPVTLSLEELETRTVPSLTIVLQQLAAVENTATTIGQSQLLAGDSDGTASIVASAPTQPANATLVDNHNGTFTFTPNAGFSGSTSFTFTVSAGQDTATGSATVTVSSLNPTTTANSFNATTPENTATMLNLLAHASDAQGVPLAVTNTMTPANATLVNNNNGTYTFTPNNGFTGSTTFTYSVAAATPQTELTAADGTAFDFFGQAVAISGNTAVITSYSKSVNGKTGQGVAYVFVESSGSWSLQAELTAADGTTRDVFGSAVALSGDTVVIGAPQHTSNGSFGAAYVFVRSGTTWTQQAELTTSDGTDFGDAVSISGDTALLGTDNEKAYVFTRSGSSWSQQQELTASDGALNHGFGTSVAVDGDTAVIGAFDHPAGANVNQGAAYVFVQSGTTWSQQQILTAPDGTGNDNFGKTVSVSGDTLVIGAPGHSVGGQAAQGAAYVFVGSGTSWSQQQELTSADGASGDNFGADVSISGDTLAIGANGKTVSGRAAQGAVYEFVRTGTSWSQQAEFTASDGTTNNGFGGAVRLSGDTLVIGALGKVINGNTNQGAAYMQQLGTAMATVTVAVNPPIVVAPSFLPGAVDGTPYSTTFTATGGSGSGYTFTESGTLPTGLTFNTSTAQLTGTPIMMIGTFSNIVITATDGSGETGSAIYSLILNAASPPPPSIPVDELGAYRASDGSWSLDSDSTMGFNSATDQVFFGFSPAHVTGVAGDWTGSGHTDIGDFNNGTWHLDLNDNGVLDPGETFQFGQAGDQPVVGDWTGLGMTNIGVFRTAPDGITGEFILDTNGDHVMDAGDETFTFGLGTDRIVVGDWNGDGRDAVGVFRDAKSFIPADAGDAVFSLDFNNNHQFDPGIDTVFVFGLITDGLIIGDWNGAGQSEVGVYRDASSAPVGSPLYAPGTALFTLDTTGDRAFDTGDQVFLYGLTTDQFVSGHWAKTPPLQAEGTPQAQFAANGPGPGGVAPLTEAQLEPVLQQAISAWAADGANVAPLEAAQVQIGSLDDNLVGETSGNQITLDATADGWGWNTDTSSADFTTTGADGLQAIPGSPAAGKMDLLTVVEHELGHELGLSDIDPATHPGNLMAATLPMGTRRLIDG